MFTFRCCRLLLETAFLVAMYLSGPACDGDLDPMSDPCKGVTCSGHGQCQVVNGSAVCVCEAGFHAEGLECMEVPELPEYCPANLRNTHPPIVVEYYGEDGVLPKDAYEPTMDDFVAATWEGVRQLTEPYQQDCLEDFITNPPGLPCSADAVLDLRLQDNSLLSFLLGVEADDLMTVPVGTPVEYSTPFGGWDVDSWGQGINLVVRKAIDGRFLLVAMGWDKLEENDHRDFGSLAVEPTYDFVCYYMEYMNCKHYGVAPVSVISGDNEYRVEPGESIVVPTSDGDYQVTLRRGKVRTCFEGEMCCGDFEANRFSYSIVLIQ